MKFCYCTLALGEKYVELARIFLDSYLRDVHTDTPVVIVTDHSSTIVDHPSVIQYKHNTSIIGAPISLKWLPYRHALSEGYDNICFIDIDSVVDPAYDEQSIINNAQDGLGCNWFIKYEQNFTKQSRGASKLRALVNEQDKYPIVCPVECFMFLTGERSRSIRFINEWHRVQQQLTEHKLYKREVCHEIGLAASRTGVPVYKYKGGRTTYTDNFTHYGTGAGKRKMIQDAK